MLNSNTFSAKQNKKNIQRKMQQTIFVLMTFVTFYLDTRSVKLAKPNDIYTSR